MIRNISREEQRECVKKDPVECDKASYINIFRESTTSDEFRNVRQTKHGTETERIFSKERMLYKRYTRFPA